jgi:hypothetical protein
MIGAISGITKTVLKKAIWNGCISCEASLTKAEVKDAHKPEKIINNPAINTIGNALNVFNTLSII